MKHSLGLLNQKDLIINNIVEKDELLDKRILDLKDSKVEGTIHEDDYGNIDINIIFNGTMYIEDSITLDSVPYDFSINIEESLDDLIENYPDSYDNSKNILDLKPILWQNIVLEVPISFTLVKDANLKGNGWELSGDVLKEDKDPRFEKLNY